MKKPTKCTTPSRDRDEYKLTAKDISNLTKLITEAYDMLVYYCVMPENKTGEIVATDGEKMDALYQAAEDLKIMLDDINLI